MKNADTTAQPMIVRYTEKLPTGIRSHKLSRFALGYVLSGTKYIYSGDQSIRAGAGSLFYLGTGTQYVENMPEGRQAFEQIVFYYTPEELQRIITHLNLSFGLVINSDHKCKDCCAEKQLVMESWGLLSNFFATTAQLVRTTDFAHDHTAEMIKLSELIYLIINHEDCCIKTRLLSNINPDDESFEEVIYDYIFREASIEELAERTNRSLTAFKREFQRHFGMPPHRWFIHQRLHHSRLLLMSTTKSISEIGQECSFANTSHYIKLFKKEYKITPANYRATNQKTE